MQNFLSSTTKNQCPIDWNLLLSPSPLAIVLLWALPGFTATHAAAQPNLLQPNLLQPNLLQPNLLQPNWSIGQPSGVGQLPEISPVAINPAPIASVVPPTEAAIAPTPALQSASQPVGRSATVIARVTTVSGLSDVQPTDWAFQALQALVERYGVIAGYPDGTFRGNQPMTRYEFAAGLNAALNRIEELINTGVGDRIPRSDLEALDKLQKEFGKELQTLRGRVDGLEGRTARLEAFQFSTTTKLNGQAIFAVNGGFRSGDRPDIDNPNTVFLSRVLLTLNTTFSGRDLLLTQLQVSTSTPVLRGSRSAGVGFDAADFLADASSGLFYSPTTGNGFQLKRLSYSLPLSKDLNVSLFARGFASDYVDYLTYAHRQFDNVENFSTTSIVSNILLFGQDFVSAGAAARWNPGGGAFTFRAVYAAQDATVPNSTGLTTLPTGLGSITDFYGNPNSDRRGGLFGDPNLGIVEAEYSPSSAFAVRVQYSGGNIGGNKYSAVGANAEYKFSPGLVAFGRFGYSANFFPDSFFGGAKPTYWQFGLAFPNLFVQNALAGISVTQPLIFQGNRVQNIDSTQTNYEIFYNYPIGRSIRVTPLFQIVTDPLNNSKNGTVFTGTLRTVFSF
jgi:porin